MKRSMILGLSMLLCGAATAGAYTLPVVGQITYSGAPVYDNVVCQRTDLGNGFDEVDFDLICYAVNVQPSDQLRINIIEGRWTAGSTGQFSVTSDGQFHPLGTTNGFWKHFPNSAINFDSVLTSSTIWTNTSGGGGRGPQTSGNLYHFFSGSWFTSFNADLVYPANPAYPGRDWPPYNDSTNLAALFVTHDTPNYGIAFDGRFSFANNGGVVGNVHFHTTPQPGDANGDNAVDISDLAVLLTNYDKTNTAWGQGDFNEDGTVDTSDLSNLLANYDKSFGSSAPNLRAVPEPSAIVLFLAGAACLLSGRWWSSRRRG